jgi:xeroderma pigmentosum group C-complementing protein
MPPYVARKRSSSPPIEAPPSKRKPPAKPARKASRFKPSLFEAVDAPTRKPKSVEETKKYLESLDNDDDEQSSLSEVDSDDFEDVEPPAKRLKTEDKRDGVNEEEEDEDDGMDWEDAIGTAGLSTNNEASDGAEIGDISISLNDDGTYVEPLVSLATGKKAPSKRERQVRMLTHCLHVQTLLWHNTVRNSWLNDKEVQKSLVDGLSEGVKREVTRWRESMGMLSREELEAKKKAAAAKNKSKGKRGSKGKGRDWGYDATHAEQGVPNLSQGDPLLRLLKVLTGYWRKRFTVTAPGLRKKGYMPLKRLRDDIRAWAKNHNDDEEFGERIEDRAAFRKMAKKCEGSRDVGAQLFVALLRGLGLETRMVANLQPIGLGNSKAEEADPKRTKKEKSDQAAADAKEQAEDTPTKAKSASIVEKPLTPSGKNVARKSTRGGKAEPIDLDASDSSLSDMPSEGDDDVSVIDVTPATPQRKPTRKYDRDLAFPSYWTEVCSPVSHKYIPVDPIVLSTIASNDELLATFEPRGKKAEISKQVIAYTIAFSSDGSAKDVTVRYLKQHRFPGKTKGMRMYAEKVPIYNRRGKVKKYEDYDWFRSVMTAYDRPGPKLTAADKLEDETDLKPFKPVKEDKETEKESLQGYKQSADFVLEIHLRREEALLPSAEPVKTFAAGKGDKAKVHDVYRREDVVPCKTVESWHKSGRAIKVGEQPIKYVPTRAVTIIRKREIEDALRETGEKAMQGLYHEAQTEWIIPDPIGPDGRIPKNAFGNMDVYVPTMVPQGAIHLPLKGSAKLCRKLQIDYAEACTGFEFGKQRAVPILTGVVVAEEYEDLVRDAWRAEQAEVKRKEDVKRTAASLAMWRKLLMGLRIVERLGAEYADAGEDGEGSNPFVKRAKRQSGDVATPQGFDEEDQGAGGFFRPGHEEEEVPQSRFAKAKQETVDQEMDGGGFLVEENAGNDGTAADTDGGFLVEEPVDDIPTNGKTSAPVTPRSLQSLHRAPSNDSGLNELSEETEDAPKPAKRSQKPPTKKVVAKPPAKRKTAAKAMNRKSSKRSVASENEDDASALLESTSEPASDFDETVSMVKSRKMSSPKVVISKSTPNGPAGKKPRGAKKATPLKSQYFSAEENTDQQQDDEEEESESDVAEVVQPRRTTARTRARGS